MRALQRCLRRLRFRERQGSDLAQRARRRGCEVTFLQDLEGAANGVFDTLSYDLWPAVHGYGHGS